MALRNALAEIKALGLQIKPVDYICSELRRAQADMPKGDPIKAAKAICEDFGLEIDPEILWSATGM